MPSFLQFADNCDYQVIADASSNPAYVAADLLSQAEHGPDSQVVLLAVDISDSHMAAIEQEINDQAYALPRVEIARIAISKSLIVQCSSLKEAMEFSNDYAPEHLILHLENARDSLKDVRNAGSVFVGAYSPESCGDYASGTNHTLPTAGYARQYSGVSTLSFCKHITSQELTPDGLKDLGPVVEQLAELEGLQAHRNAVTVRLQGMGMK
jgi:phosphoribosyl-ATP pyrophosphohydrolase/phosphoribosyl-AMP cyclohydrolase/histidinol dehydrogenase